jgi:hypothetical protein
MTTEREKKIISYRPIAHFESSIGSLVIFSISYRHNQELLESLGEDLTSCEPMHFMKNLLLYICYPIDAIGEEQNKPDDIVLSSDDINRLTEDEIDKIAKLYVEYEPYLYRKSISKTQTGEDGINRVTIDYGDIEHPQEDGESNYRYLHRLYIIKDKKEKAENTRFIKSTLGAANFSAQLFKNISNTLLMGNSVVKGIEAMRFPYVDHSFAKVVDSISHPLMSGVMTESVELMNGLQLRGSPFTNLGASVAQKVKPIAVEPEHMKIDMNSLAKSAAEAEWAPFEFLADRIDNLTKVSSDSATFLVKMNTTQTAIASEIKASGESASRLSKWNLAIAIVIVFLTIFGLGLAWWNQGRDNQDTRAIRSHAEVLKSLVNEMRQERMNENIHLEKEINEKSMTLERLQRQLATERETIEQLRTNIQKLNKSNRTRSP